MLGRKCVFDLNPFFPRIHSDVLAKVETYQGGNLIPISQCVLSTYCVLSSMVFFGDRDTEIFLFSLKYSQAKPTIDNHSCRGRETQSSVGWLCLSRGGVKSWAPAHTASQLRVFLPPEAD